jgi:hypothetical protein
MPLHRHGAQQREQRAHGLADAGGRLRQQAAALGGRAVHGFGQVALAGAEGRLRERPAAAAPASRAARCRASCCAQARKAAALRQQRVQLVGAEDLAQFDLGLAPTSKYTSASAIRQAAGAAEQRAVGLQLRPVQQAAVGADLVRVAADGLDLFQAAAPRVVAVGAAAHAQRAAGLCFVVGAAPLQGDLGLVVGPAPLRTDRWVQASGPSGLPARWRTGREAPVQVAALGGELAQLSAPTRCRSPLATRAPLRRPQRPVQCRERHCG